MTLRFESLRLTGWKSIKDATIEFRPLNILIGANGAGKSNLIGFFRFLNEMVQGRLQLHIAQTGNAESLLYFGPRTTPQLSMELRFTSDEEENVYSATWVAAQPSGMVFESETLELRKSGSNRSSQKTIVIGQTETYLLNTVPELKAVAQKFRDGLLRCRLFHFHDTSEFSPLRRECSVDQNREFQSNGANLPAMLYLYREKYKAVYHRIVASVRAVAPWFDDFVLEPLRLRPRDIALEWRMKQHEGVFGAHQLSDGTIRFIALSVLLQQPDEDRPEMIILDEPELGLHPAAVAILADLLKDASAHQQILLATQSPALLDHFAPEDVITVNFRDGESKFERLDAESLKAWLDDEFSLSNLWERNVIGGGPY